MRRREGVSGDPIQLLMSGAANRSSEKSATTRTNTADQSARYVDDVSEKLMDGASLRMEIVMWQFSVDTVVLIKTTNRATSVLAWTKSALLIVITGFESLKVAKMKYRGRRTRSKSFTLSSDVVPCRI